MRSRLGGSATRLIERCVKRSRKRTPIACLEALGTEVSLQQKLSAQIVSAGATIGPIGFSQARGLTQYPQTPKDAGLVDL